MFVQTNDIDDVESFSDDFIFTPELKACPFCGGPAMQHEDGSVSCKCCSAETETVDDWNERNR